MQRILMAMSFIIMIMTASALANPFDYSAGIGGIKIGDSPSMVKKKADSICKYEEKLNNVGGKYIELDCLTATIMEEFCFNVKIGYEKNKVMVINFDVGTAQGHQNVIIIMEKTANAKYLLDDGSYRYVYDNCFVVTSSNDEIESDDYHIRVIELPQARRK